MWRTFFTKLKIGAKHALKSAGRKIIEFTNSAKYKAVDLARNTATLVSNARNYDEMRYSFEEEIASLRQKLSEIQAQKKEDRSEALAIYKKAQKEIEKSKMIIAKLQGENGAIIKMLAYFARDKELANELEASFLQKEIEALNGTLPVEEQIQKRIEELQTAINSLKVT